MSITRPANHSCRVSVIAFCGQTQSPAAVSTGSDPAGEWQRYLENSTDAQPGYRFPHATCFRAAALAYDLPQTLLLAVARGESDFDESARSRANAHGVMQILWPVTANHLGIYRLSELYDPCTNIDAGARYLQEMLARYDGDIHLALAAYKLWARANSSRRGGYSVRSRLVQQLHLSPPELRSRRWPT